jgi:hypothetical protein
VTDDLRTALAPLARATSAHTRAVRDVETHLRESAAAQKERDERAAALAVEVREALRALETAATAERRAVERATQPEPEPEPGPVAKAAQDVAVESLTGIQRGIRAAGGILPGAWAWLSADRSRTLLLLSTVGLVLVQLAKGAPLLVAIGSALVRLGTGGAP